MNPKESGAWLNHDFSLPLLLLLSSSLSCPMPNSVGEDSSNEVVRSPADDLLHRFATCLSP